MRIVEGASNFDGICRPLGFQTFVFVDGMFAGTLSPDVMGSRSDGGITGAQLSYAGITAEFSRYTDTDPLCCPSATNTASYTIDRSSGLPLVLLTSTFTQPSEQGE